MNKIKTKREKFIEGLDNMFDSIYDVELDHPLFEDTVGDIIRAVVALYDKLTEQRCGEWKYHSNPTIGINPETAYCSCCGFRVDTTGDIDFDEYNFCPRCGADMRGEQDE